MANKTPNDPRTPKKRFVARRFWSNGHGYWRIGFPSEKGYLAHLCRHPRCFFDLVSAAFHLSQFEQSMPPQNDAHQCDSLSGAFAATKQRATQRQFVSVAIFRAKIENKNKTKASSFDSFTVSKTPRALFVHRSLTLTQHALQQLVGPRGG